MQVFVSGLPYEISEDKLKAFFDQDDHKLMDKVTHVKLHTFFGSNKSKGYAHVTFETKEAYDAALNFSGRTLGKKDLDIKPATGMSSTKSQSPGLK